MSLVLGVNPSHQGGLGGDREKPGKGATGVALQYHKFEEFKNLSKEQQQELTEWNKANGGGSNQRKKKGKRLSPAGSPHNNSSNEKKFITSTEAHLTSSLRMSVFSCMLTRQQTDNM